MKTIPEQVAVMLAADEGEIVTVTPDNGTPTYRFEPDNHFFDWSLNGYEIVKEPWEGYTNLYPDNKIGSTFIEKDKAEKNCYEGGRTVKVREVIE